MVKNSFNSGNRVNIASIGVEDKGIWINLPVTYTIQ